MALPTLKTLRSADIDRLYDPDLPWVEPARCGRTTFYMRMAYAQPEAEPAAGGAFVRGETVAIVRKADLAEPDRGTLIIIGPLTDETDWTVDTVAHANPWEWRLTLEKQVRAAFGSR